MSVAGSTSSQGTRSRSPSRSRSPPYSDGRYPPSSRYSRYDSYNYRPNRNGMSAALDDYRDLRDRERDRDRDRSMGLMRDDRYLSPRARESHDRYTPSYYRDDIPPHHYPSSSSPRDYPKTNPLRRDVSLDQVKDANKLTTSSSNNSIKDSKEDTKPIASNTSEPYSSNRYMDWRDRDRDRERDRDRRYREDDRRRDYDRRGYMRDLRYESSSYGGPPPPPPPMNYQMASFGGDSYRPDRDRDRDMPPSPNIPYYERERIDDRDFYRPGRNSSASTNTIEYDRYRTRSRPNWANKLPEDASRRLDRDRPERDRSPFKKLDDKKEDTIEKSSITTTDGLETGEVVEEQSNSSTHIVPMSSQPSQSQLSSRIATTTTTPPPLQEGQEEQEQEQEDNDDDDDNHDEETKDVQTELKTQTRIESETVTEPDTETVFESESIIESKQVSDSKQEYESKQVSESQIVTEPKVNSLSPSPPPPPAAPPPLSTERNKSPSPSPSSSPSPSPSPSSPLQSPLLPSSQKQTEQQDESKAEIINESSSSRAESPMEISPEPTTKPITTTTTTTTHQEQDSPQMEQGEVIEEDEEMKAEMTQEEIVNRIDDIETELSREEMLLAEAEKREQEALEQEALEQSMLEEEDEEEAATTAAQNKEEAKKQALQAMEDEPSSSATATDLNNFTEDSLMRKRPQLLINQLRSRIDVEDDLLYEKILLDNKQVAKHNGSQTKEEEDEWSDEEEWKKPLYPSIQEYPCYKENMLEFNQIRPHIAHALATQKIALAKKKIFLKKEFKGLYEQWKEKNLLLDRVRERNRTERFAGHRTSSRRLQEQQQEEYIDGVIFVANSEDALRFSNGGASTPYNTSGYYTSDAARSEAELLEIIQSLESAEMRNPESRAKKTTATIPPMILDVRERMRTYDDRSGLVEDPLTYYHTGQDTGDVWNQQEITTFMESYMMYPKQFERISQAIGTKTACQCVLFYYRKKKKIDFKALMKKGRRGKANKNRDRIAAAIRLATSDSSSPTGRKAKSKGSALMTDIGEAQNSRKAKEKDAERKSRELRELEEANLYWESVAERKKTKRSSSGPSLPPTPSTPLPPTTSQSQQRLPISTTSAIQSGPSTSHISDDTEMISTTNTEKRRFNTYSTNGTEKRRSNKGRSPRESNPAVVESPATLPNEPSNVTLKRYSEDQPMETKPEDQETVSPTTTSNSVAKWSDREKEMAVDAFKEHGRDFVQVSSLVKSKTEEQCRNFYHNFKRKFGPNAFNEEDTRPTTNEPTSAAAPTTNVHNELVAISGRTDLKAEEEDAAAALVGMFQMGANITLNGGRSRTPSSDVVLSGQTPKVPLALPPKPLPTTKAPSVVAPPQPPSPPPVATAPVVTLPPPAAATAVVVVPPPSLAHPNVPVATVTPMALPMATPPLVPSSSSSSTSVMTGIQKPLGLQQPQHQSLQQVHSQVLGNQQKRRRVRSSSSRAESITGDDTPEWSDAEFGGRSGGRKLGRTTSLSESKRPAYSSYWSVSERNEFLRLLSIYGRDWERVANEMKSKTVIQVRNFYVNNEEKMHLKQVVDRHHSNKQPHDSPKTFDTSAAAHFQALQNFPFPSPIIDQPQPQQSAIVTSTPITNYPPSRVRYFSSPPPQSSLSPRNTTNYSSSSSTSQQQQHNRNSSSTVEPVPSAVTKVADLLNNDDSAEPNQNWETWFGS